MNNSSVSHFRINVFSVFVAFLLALIYLWIQNGVLPPDILGASKALSLSVCLLFIPDLIMLLFSAKFKFLSISLITFSLIFLASLSGFFCRYSNISLSILIGLLAAGSLILYLFSNRKALNKILVAALWGCFFGLVLGFFFWGVDFHSPIFLERMMYTKNISADNLFHTSVANIFNTYSIPSTGLDGVPYIHYHWGSHVLFASISNLLGLNLLTFHNLVYPVVFIPLYFKAILLLVQSLQRIKSFNNSLNSISFLLLFVLHSRIFYNPESGFSALTPFNSEPYLIGLIFSFLIMDIILNDYSVKKTFRKLTFIILPVGIVLISGLKISLGFLISATVFYFFLRFRCYFKLRYWIYFGLLAIAFFFSYKTFTLTSNEAFNILRPLGMLRWVGIYYIPYYFVLLFSVFLILIFDLKDNFFEKVNSGKYFDIEIVSFIAIIGLVPGMIWYMSGNRHYFFDFQYWMSVILMLTYIPYFREKTIITLSDNKSFLIVKVFILLILINFGIREINKSSQLFGSIIKNKNEIKEIKRDPKINDLEMQFVQNLKVLESLPVAEKKQSCIYINDADSLFKNLPEDYRFSLSFIVPAVTGICSIEGISGDRNRKDFYILIYKYYKSSTFEQVTSRAKELGFKYLYQINTDPSGGNNITKITLQP